jgi:CubicO group peptidase (beta-lactamase class C family)
MIGILRGALLAMAVLVAAAPAVAEVKEDLYGKAEGYPFELGWPFRTIPKFRAGALTGKGLGTLERRAPPFWMPPATQPIALPRQAMAFGSANDPDALLRKHPILAMMLVRDGAVVFERYRYGTTPETLFDGQSIPKGFTGLAIGTLFDDGLLTDLDARMGALVPDLADSPIGAATLRDTLHMQCGHAFKWSDDGTADSSAAQYAAARFGAADGRAKDLYQYFRTLPPAPPGRTFAYDPHCSDALSMVVTKATGRSLRAWFTDRVWTRLGPRGRAAWLSPTRHPELTSGASGFYATLEDYARIGMVLLDGGTFLGRPVISKEWIERMRADSVPVGSYPSNFKRYGLHVWVRTDAADSWFAPLGNYGQRLYVDPANRAMMIQFALDETHIADSDRFWDRFRTR